MIRNGKKQLLETEIKIQTVLKNVDTRSYNLALNMVQTFFLNCIKNFEYS